MRTGSTIIDNKDAYTTYGVIVSDFREIATWPAIKKPRTVDYPEEDGIRADLSDLKLDSREIDVTFITVSDAANTGALLAALGGTGYHTFEFMDIAKTLQLRYVGQTEHQRFGKIRSISIRLADDKPMDGYTYSAPIMARPVPDQGYQLDGDDFSTWGVRVLDGTDASIEKAPEAKTGLLISEQSQNGSTWDDGQTVRYKEKWMDIKCLLYSASPQEFWNNYLALLYDLTRTGARSITSDTEQTALPCYYERSKVSRFELTDNGAVWCEFTIKMVVTNSKPEADLILFSTQNDEFVETISNELIDLSHDNI